MASESQAQHGYAGMSSTPKGRAKLRAEGRKPMPAKVAQEYLRADSGRNIGRLAEHVVRGRKK